MVSRKTELKQFHWCLLLQLACLTLLLHSSLRLLGLKNWEISSPIYPLTYTPSPEARGVTRRTSHHSQRRPHHSNIHSTSRSIMTTPPIPAQTDPLTSLTPITPAEIEQAISQEKLARRQKTHYTHLQPSSGQCSPSHSRSSSVGSNDIAAAAGASTNAYGEVVVHEIRPGDTLEGICLMYGAKVWGFCSILILLIQHTQNTNTYFSLAKTTQKGIRHKTSQPPLDNRLHPPPQNPRHPHPFSTPLLLHTIVKTPFKLPLPLPIATSHSNPLTLHRCIRFTSPTTTSRRPLQESGRRPP